jgi:hypothetical protein
VPFVLTTGDFLIIIIFVIVAQGRRQVKQPIPRSAKQTTTVGVSSYFYEFLVIGLALQIITTSSK